MKKSQRSRRVGDLVGRELSTLLTSIRLDPDPGFVTITGCEVTVDLRLARVHYSVYGPPESWERAAIALDKVRGRLRREIGHRLSLRYTPELELVPDHTAETADRIERALLNHPVANEAGESEIDDEGGDETDG